jgi:hypothetical protein
LATRQEMILNSNFLKDRQDLAMQLLRFENDGKGFLPNSPRHVEIPPSAFNFGNKQVRIGRIDKYYYFGIEIEEGDWKYTAFENEGMCNYFFHSIPEIDDKTLAFWKTQVKRLAEHF